MKHWMIRNGEFFGEDQPVISVNDSAYRYGAGLFETMLMTYGKIKLLDYHFKRLTAGMRMLKMSTPKELNPDSLLNMGASLANRNKCENHCRIRLVISVEPGNHQSNYSIQCHPLSPDYLIWNEIGFRLGIYRNEKKTISQYSQLKSTNYLLYFLAAAHAREQGYNDCLILNEEERICESSIANIFWFEDECWFTPPVSEGCVAGVMRQYLLDNPGILQFPLKERVFEENHLAKAEEIFLTNAVYGMRWVGQIMEYSYASEKCSQIFDRVNPTFKV